MSREQVWRGIVCRCYGKKFASASQRIWMDLWCVINGIKSAWLVDYLPLDVTKMRQLLEDSKSAGLFAIQEHSVAILMLNTDVLVVNTSIQLATPPTMFIDVSVKLDKPLIVSECVWESVTCAIQAIHGAITDAAAKTCSEQLLVLPQLTLADDVNLSTIFGWLLGYPVVYWFDSNSSSNSWDHASLSSLVCYSAVVSNAQVKDHELYSFTIPGIFQDQLDACINKWFIQLTDTACRKGCNLKLKNKIVSVQHLMI